MSAGVKQGFSYGESDDFGFKAAVDETTVYDFNATLLHLMGLDHERLTFYHNGSPTADGFPTHMSVDYVRVWRLSGDSAATPPASTDWSKQQYLAKEKANWEKNGWAWNQAKVESNFAEIDTNNDGVASGKERQDWFAKNKAANDKR